MSCLYLALDCVDGGHHFLRSQSDLDDRALLGPDDVFDRSDGLVVDLQLTVTVIIRDLELSLNTRNINGNR